MRVGTNSFYDTPEWLAVRYEALKASNGRCACCGNGPSKASPLHVDHIKPRSKHPELSLALNNLQVLCKSCNLGKSNKDDTDWRWVTRVDEVRLVAWFSLTESEKSARRDLLERALWGSTKGERQAAQKLLDVIDRYARDAFTESRS